MGSVSRYIQLVRIDATGRRKVANSAIAQAFFRLAFPKLSEQEEVADAIAQRQLLQSLEGDSECYHRAQLCLRCFVSWQIDRVCQQLEVKFGRAHGFSSRELLPLVLDDDGQCPPSPYPSLALEILNSFDRTQGSLSTWTNLRVKHHPELNSFLLDCGVYMVSDWAILNDTSPPQLERILSEFHHLTAVEIQQGAKLLSNYHQVYRQERLQRRQRQRSRHANGRCQPPTPEQLAKIAKGLRSPLAPEAILGDLQTLASQLREYRIAVRQGSLPTESLDASVGDRSPLKEQIAAPAPDDSAETDNAAGQFLQAYRRQFLACLERSIAEVIEARYQKFQRRQPEKAQQFLAGLSLFHCQGKSMAEIATLLGLKAQYQVTRLLKLKTFRADVRQVLLAQLLEQVLTAASAYATPERLQALESEIEATLAEQVNREIEAAQIEASTAKKTSTPSQFSQRLCAYLEAKQ